THVGITPAPGGRLWVYWERGGVIYYTRTNPEVTKFGAVLQTNAPKPGDSIYRLSAEGSRERLYMLALDGPPGGSPNWWGRAVAAGLTCKALGNGKVKPGKKITFQVTDAGDPVVGASFFAFIGGR